MHRDQGTDPSWYATRQPVRPPRPVPDGDIEAEVGIVGGGLSGLSTALQLAERGVSVVLLEAEWFGAGASGRNGGQALQGYAAAMPALEAAVGRTCAQVMWDMSRDALALLKDRVARFGIACELAQNGYLYAAVHAGQMAELGHWRRHAAERYHYPDLIELDRSALRQHVASDAYIGALYDPHEVHLDPLAYTLGLAQAAERAGARLYEQSRVGSWRQDGERLLVQAPWGRLRCRKLLFAVNTGAGALVPSLARYFLPVESFIVATEPLGADAARALLPGGAALADCNRVLNYFRTTSDHRLLFGGRAGGTRANRAEGTRRRMLAVFPQLAGARIDHAWGGHVDVPLNKLPHFGRLADKVYFVQGFCGHGLALTGLAGQLVAEAMCGRPERFDLFARIQHRRLPTYLPGFNRTAVALGMASQQLLDWADARRHRS
ncbi:FAD-binding oxidoreductase [Chitinimonas arctica]|uniref:FAD-binding oxidoreductase n=1 Tax=Chitinimonas arctica TaxID=2594795 RepID=A0A516SAZ8_9NEIS|nr:FAD-binding oxidoreductase [Chitinimonas arctica]QDQ25322.1 FAD-binding oxidoreductase [Chitinimonas arctica]